MIAALVSLMLSQTGICKPGVACQVNSIQPVCVTTANLGTCNVAGKGTVRCDKTTNELKVCDGVSTWWPIASTAGTGDFVKVAGDQMTGGLSTPQVDAGIIKAGNGVSQAIAVDVKRTNWLCLDSTFLTDGGCAQGWRASSVSPGGNFTGRVLASDGGVVTRLNMRGQPGNVFGRNSVFQVLDDNNGLIFDATLEGYSSSQGFCPYDGGTCWTGQATQAISVLSGDVNNTAYPVSTSWATFARISGTVVQMCWTPETVGTGAGNIVGTFFDRTGSANTSTLTIPCASTQGTPTCANASGAISSSDIYDFRWTTDGCTLRPAGELTLTYTVP